MKQISICRMFNILFFIDIFNLSNSILQIDNIKN